MNTNINIDSCDLHNALCEAENLRGLADKLPSNAPQFYHIANKLSEATNLFINHYEKIESEILKKEEEKQ